MESIIEPIWSIDKEVSLRDWFASIERSEPPMSMVDGIEPTAEALAVAYAKWRFMCADAMLAERSKTEGKEGKKGETV